MEPGAEGAPWIEDEGLDRRIAPGLGDVPRWGDDDVLGERERREMLLVLVTPAVADDLLERRLERVLRLEPAQRAASLDPARVLVS